MSGTPRPVRKSLRHNPPAGLEDAIFFITICVLPKGSDLLIEPRIAERLLSAANTHHENRRWWLRLLVIMPDHIHALASFYRDVSMASCVGDWKRFTSRQCGISWQKNFFEHRLRNEENLQLKAAYIRENPVRAGLVASAEGWPWRLENCWV